tara:strand:- start:8986 stop:9525 length:540 start_codon:yes stop_codon:yes gene_type:complete
MIKLSIMNLLISILILYLVYINIISKINFNTNSCPKCPKCPTQQCSDCANNLYNNAYRYNYNQLFNPLISPTRYLQYLPNYLKSIASRGYTSYGVIGNISSTDSNNNTIVKRLIGRPKYHGSSQWEYYAVDKDNIKYTIDHEKELYKNDTIKVNEYKDKIWTLHKFDSDPPFLRYNPYI